MPEPCCLKETLQTPPTLEYNTDIARDPTLRPFEEKLDEALVRVLDHFQANILASIAVARTEGGEEAVRARCEDIQSGVCTMLLQEIHAAVPGAHELRDVIAAVARERVACAMASLFGPP